MGAQHSLEKGTYVCVFIQGFVLSYFFFTKQLAFLVFSEFLPSLKSAGEKDVLQLAGSKPVLEGCPDLQGGFVTQRHHHGAVGHTPVFGVHLKFSVLLMALMLLQ